VPPGSGQREQFWVVGGGAGIVAASPGLVSAAVALDLTGTNAAYVFIGSDGLDVVTATHYVTNEDVAGMSPAELTWLFAGMGSGLVLWGWCYGKRLIATQLAHEGDSH